MATVKAVDKVLQGDDVAEVVSQILDAKTKSKLLGRILRIRADLVDGIIQQYDSPDDRLFNVIDEFVKHNENPTLRVIVNALKNPLIGLPNLARAIEKEYCQPIPEQNALHSNSNTQLDHSMLATQVPHLRTTFTEALQYLWKKLLFQRPRTDAPHIRLISVDTPDDTSVLSPTRLTTLQEVKEKINELEAMFSELKERTIKLLVKHRVKVQRAAYVISDLPADMKAEHISFLTKHTQELSEHKEHIHLFMSLNLYWNYLSPCLLEHLVNKLDCLRKIRNKMSLYKETLQMFRVQTPLKLFCQTQSKLIKPTDEVCNVVAKYESEISMEMTLQDVENFRQKYAYNYNLYEFTLQLHYITKGSFIASFVAPMCVVDVLQENIPKDILIEFGITQLMIAGNAVYNVNVKSSIASPELILTSGKMQPQYSTALTTAVYHSISTATSPPSTKSNHSTSIPEVELSTLLPCPKSATTGPCHITGSEVSHSTSAAAVPCSTSSTVLSRPTSITLSSASAPNLAWVSPSISATVGPPSLQTAAVGHSTSVTASTSVSEVSYPTAITAIPCSTLKTSVQHSIQYTAPPYSVSTVTNVAPQFSLIDEIREQVNPDNILEIFRVTKLVNDDNSKTYVATWNAMRLHESTSTNSETQSKLTVSAVVPHSADTAHANLPHSASPSVPTTFVHNVISPIKLRRCISAPEISHFMPNSAKFVLALEQLKQKDKKLQSIEREKQSVRQQLERKKAELTTAKETIKREQRRCWQMKQQEEELMKANKYKLDKMRQENEQQENDARKAVEELHSKEAAISKQKQKILSLNQTLKEQIKTKDVELKEIKKREKKLNQEIEQQETESLKAKDRELAQAQKLLEEKERELIKAKDTIKKEKEKVQAVRRLKAKEDELTKREKAIRQEQQLVREIKEQETKIIQDKDRELADIRESLNEKEELFVITKAELEKKEKQLVLKDAELTRAKEAEQQQREKLERLIAPSQSSGIGSSLTSSAASFHLRTPMLSDSSNQSSRESSCSSLPQHSQKIPAPFKLTKEQLPL